METICKNCGNRYEGNYCNQCGQKAKIGKLTLRSVIDNWAYGLTNCDTGILFTYKELFTRPGHMLADYIRGKRVIYFQPFPMLFITAGLYGLLSEILLPSVEKESVPVATIMTFQDRFLHILSGWIHTSMSFTVIITLPVFAWAAQCTFRNPHFHPYIPNTFQLTTAWFYQRLFRTGKNYFHQLSDYLFTSTYICRNKYLHRKKYDYNFTEYIFIFAYIACQRLVIGIFLTLPILVFTNEPKLVGGWSTLVYSIYFFLIVWDFKQLFNLSIWKATKKAILLFLNGLLIILLLLFIMTAIVVLIFYIGKETGLLSEDTIKNIGDIFN